MTQKLEFLTDKLQTMHRQLEVEKQKTDKYVTSCCSLLQDIVAITVVTHISVEQVKKRRRASVQITDVFKMPISNARRRHQNIKNNK